MHLQKEPTPKVFTSQLSHIISTFYSVNIQFTLHHLNQNSVQIYIPFFFLHPLHLGTEILQALNILAAEEIKHGITDGCKLGPIAFILK